MEDKAKQASFLLLVNLSVWRIALPFLGMHLFGFWGVVPGIATAYFCHLAVNPYLGLRLFSVRKIDTEADFVPLKRWMIPNSENEITERGYKKLASEASEEVRIRLKNKSEKLGYVSIYDYVNAALIDEQIFNRESSNRKTALAASEFFSKRN